MVENNTLSNGSACPGALFLELLQKCLLRGFVLETHGGSRKSLFRGFVLENESRWGPSLKLVLQVLAQGLRSWDRLTASHDFRKACSVGQ